MLHLVAFALSKLSVSSRDVALGIVLRIVLIKNPGTTPKTDSSDSNIFHRPENNKPIILA